MKTKMKLHLIIYITIVGFLTACENEIPYNPGQQDCLLYTSPSPRDTR